MVGSAWRAMGCRIGVAGGDISSSDSDPEMLRPAIEGISSLAAAGVGVGAMTGMVTVGVDMLI